MAKRRCKAKTKAGNRCKNGAMGNGFCIAHASRKVKVSQGFGGPQKDSGRPRKPRVVDVLLERVEEKVEAIIAPYMDAVEGACLFTNYEGEVHVSIHPDLGARIAAAEKLLDRVYGKPKQRTELTGGDGDPVQMEVIGAAILGDKKTRKRLADARRSVAAPRTK